MLERQSGSDRARTEVCEAMLGIIAPRLRLSDRRALAVATADVSDRGRHCRSCSTLHDSKRTSSNPQETESVGNGSMVSLRTYLQQGGADQESSPPSVACHRALSHRASNASGSSQSRRLSPRLGLQSGCSWLPVAQSRGGQCVRRGVTSA